MWLPLTRPLLGTWPATQACVLTGNQTGDPLVCRLALNPLSHTSQGRKLTLLISLALILGCFSKLCDCPNYLLCSLWLPVVEGELYPISVPKGRLQSVQANGRLDFQAAALLIWVIVVLVLPICRAKRFTLAQLVSVFPSGGIALHKDSVCPWEEVSSGGSYISI